jgi:hypothetical protein
MRRFLLLALLVVMGVMTWRLGSALSSDALGMAVGVVFGVLAGIPTALLVLATNSRHRAQEEEELYERYERRQQRQDRQLPAYPYQPPVIVVAGAQAPQAAPQGAPLPGHGPYYVPNHQGNSWEPAQSSQRRYKVVGEREEWIE